MLFTKEFNSTKSHTFKIRIVSAQEGAWYSDLIGQDIETNGYDFYDKKNEWRVNSGGLEKKIAHNDARQILPGNVPMWSTIYTKGIAGEHGRILVVSGYSATSGCLQTTSVGSGGSGLTRPDNVKQILDPGKCHDESEAWCIAHFYDVWKRKERTLCPKCKGRFECHSLYDEKNLLCTACLDDRPTWREKFLSHPAIQLTDEDVRKYNSDVLFKYYKWIFTVNTGRLDPDHVGWISPDCLENLMENGAKVKYHYDILGKERVFELRELFKKCYANGLHLLKKRDKEREAKK